MLGDRGRTHCGDKERASHLAIFQAQKIILVDSGIMLSSRLRFSRDSPFVSELPGKPLLTDAEKHGRRTAKIPSANPGSERRNGRSCRQIRPRRYGRRPMRKPARIYKNPGTFYAR
jgi:hypothetical protein